MGAFDRIQGYSANVGFVSKYEDVSVGVGVAPQNVNTSQTSVKKGVSDFFDVTTPLGYFLNSLHNLGFLVVNTFYANKSIVSPTRGDLLTEEEYLALDDTEKPNYKADTYLTEFAEMLLAKDDVLAVSCAGSGKTSALIFKIIKDIVTGETLKQVAVPNGSVINTVDSIFVGTFLKSGADELKAKLGEWQRKLGYFVTADRINFGTLHAEFKRVLNDMGVGTPIGSQTKLREYLNQAAKDLGISRADGSPMTFDDYANIESILAYYRNRLDSKRYEHPTCQEYSMTPLVLDKLYSIYQYYKQSDGVMDFEDLQELLYKHLYTTPNKAVQDYVANRYRYIYLDEFQDTSQIQYAILKFYARGRLACNKTMTLNEGIEQGLYTGERGVGKIICIGDDDQAIYSWRGSDIKIITEKFVNDFNPNMVQLSVNYRCPYNILKPVISSITKNEDRYAKKLRSANTGGEFEAREFAGLPQMSGYLLDKIDKDMADGHSVAIVCRTNFDGMIPALMLEDQHKYLFSISSDAMTLSSSFAKSAMEVTSLFTSRISKSVEKTLLSLVPYYEKHKVKELMATLRNDDANNVKTSVWAIPERDLRYSVPSLFNLIVALKDYMFDADGKRIDGGDVSALMYLYTHLCIKVYNKDNAYCEKMRGYLSVLIQMLDRKKYESVSSFVDDINIMNDNLHARIRANKVVIKVVTVHEFKGKEADSVYVWNDSKDVFPTKKTDMCIKEQVEEERRVHYIACTRAKKRCGIYTLKEHGYFFDELECSVSKLQPVSGTLLKSFEASKSKSSSDADVKVLSGFEDKPIETTLPTL